MNNVISTRVSVFRNLKDFKFSNKLNDEQKQTITALLEKELKTQMKLANVKILDKATLENLNEKALILNNVNTIFLDKKEDVVINMFSDEHISIVSAGAGFSRNIIENALKLSQTLSNKISFAFSDEYGYLMSDISKIGAGIRIETNILLNSLKAINKIEQVKQNIAKLGYSLKETKINNVYTLSTMCNLGIGEKQICLDFENTLLKLQELEIESLKMIDMSKHDEIIDKAERSWAILNSCYLLNYDELFNMTLNLRMALNLGIKQIKIEILNKLHHLILRKASETMSVEEMKQLAVETKEILKGEKDV